VENVTTTAAVYHMRQTAINDGKVFCSEFGFRCRHE